MFPEAIDNYEGESNGSYKAILRLVPAHPSAPPILVMATNQTIFHAIILHNQNQNDDNDAYSDTESCTGSDWSSSVFGRVRNNKREPPNLSLFVFESLDINPSPEQAKHHNDNSLSQNKQDTNIILRPDSSTPSRYFC